MGILARLGKPWRGASSVLGHSLHLAACKQPCVTHLCALHATPPPPQDTEGITWSSLGDDNNGLPAVMIIFAVEWVVFMLAAW